MTHTQESTQTLEPCLSDEIIPDLNNIVRAIEDEGDRCYLGSTNDAERLREIANWLETKFRRTPPASQSDEALINVGPINRIPGSDSISCPGLPSGMMCFGWGEQGWAINDKDGKRIAAGNWGECATLPASQSEALTDLTRETEALGLYGGQSDEALVTQADREAVKRHQQRFLAEGTSETKLLLEAFASHRLAALRAVWTPVDVVGLGARMATLTDSNALPTTIQLIVDMYDALERLSHERASARAEGKREGIEDAAEFIAKHFGMSKEAAIRALAEKQP